MNIEDILGAFLLVNNPIVLSEEEIKDVQKAIKELQQENKQLQQQCKKQQEVIDNINLIIKGLAYGGNEDYYMENFSKINELLKEVSY